MNPKSITKNDLQEAVKTIEEEFGLVWLKRKAALPSTKTIHPVPQAWLTAIRAIEQLTQNRNLILPPSVIWLNGLGHNMRLAKKIKGYSDAIPYRLKESKEFSDVEYEITVASMWAKTEYDIEFVPRKAKEGIKSPDLKITFKDISIYVECKRKDTYLDAISSEGNEFFDKLSLGIQEWHDNSTKKTQSSVGIDILIVIPGEQNLIDVDQILIDLCAKMESEVKNTGWTGKKAAYIVKEFSNKEALQNENNGFGIFLPATYNPGWVSAKVAEDADGKRYAANPLRLAVFKIKSHKFSSLHNSFNKARKQIPKNSLGLIYLDVDISRLQYPEVTSYLPMIADSIGKELAESVNTRIAGVVITTQPIIRDAQIGSVKGRTQIRFIHIKRNPHVPLPDGFSIPHEQTK